MNNLVDKALDKLWDVMEPVAGKCPVCAFFRGLLLGLLVALMVQVSHYL